MKKYIAKLFTFLFLGCLSILSLYAQAPGAMTYQAEVRNSKGDIIKNTDFDVTIGILEGSTETTPILTYYHPITTDKYGLFTVTIGDPTDPYDPLYSLDWETEPHYLEVQVTDDKNNTYNLGTTQLLSVPYALHAETANYAVNDNVDDADASSLNELQNLTLEDDILKLSLTNDEVSLGNYVSHWRLWGDDLLQFTGAVDIGDNYSSGPALRVDGTMTLGKSGENAGTYGISGPSTESGLALIGGKFASGQIYLYGPDHASHPGEVRLKAGSYDRIIIKPDGNVGIGTSTPNYNLDVSGDINFTGTLHQGGSPLDVNNWDEAYGWGNHSIAGYLKSFIETDPVFTPSEAANITAADITNLSNLSGINTGDQDLSNLSLKSNVLELDNTTTFTPDADYEPATKKYVDDNAGATQLNDLSDAKTSGSSVYVGPLTGLMDDGTTNRKNTAFGAGAGAENAGEGNIFLGFMAGFKETGDNKLYINNSSGKPLIHGDFATEIVTINGDLDVENKVKGADSGNSDMKAYIYGRIDENRNIISNSSTDGFTVSKYADGIRKITFTGNDKPIGNNSYIVLVTNCSTMHVIVTVWHKAGYFLVITKDIDEIPAIEGCFNFVVYKK